MTDSSLPPTELSDFEDVGSADDDDGVGSTIDDATAKFEFELATRQNTYRVTDLDVVFKETGNGGIIMLFATTRWCCWNRNYSAVLGCQVQ